MAQNGSITQTRDQMDRFEKLALAGDPDIEHWSSYVGQGAVRFVLSYDVQPASPNFGQIVIVARDIAARDRLRAKTQAIIARDFVGTDAYVHLLDIGPPVGRAVQYRVSGPDIQTVRSVAQKVATAISGNAHLSDIVYDWNEPGRVVKVDVLQDKAAQLGITSETIATALNGIIGGATATQVRDSIYLVSVIGRARDGERSSIETLQNLQIQTSAGKAVPLAAVANFRYESEQPVVWRRGRLPTITVKAAVDGTVQPATVVEQLAGRLGEISASLPAGYRIATAGAVEESAKGQAPIVAIVPIMLFAMATILMIQLQSFQRLFLVVIVAPLGLIGVVAALLPSGAPLGFVAILGVLALIGILIRNSSSSSSRSSNCAAKAWMLDRGGRGDRAPHAPDHADRGGSQPRFDPDRPRGVLGADGLCHDGRNHRRHRADAAVPPGALHRLVPPAGASAAKGGCRHP